MQFAVTSPFLGSLLVRLGRKVLSLVGGGQPTNVTGGATTGPAIPIRAERVSYTIIATGTVDDATVITLEAEINGSSFVPVMRNGAVVEYTGAQIKARGNAGIFDTVDLVANNIRFRITTLGTTSGANGFITRVMAG